MVNATQKRLQENLSFVHQLLETQETGENKLGDPSVLSGFTIRRERRGARGIRGILPYPAKVIQLVKEYRCWGCLQG